ncbi:MAG: amidinotransferase [Planctomycetes bacterium]|nr:amidinotransferase [Planctomycetota bacterium]
MADPAGFCVQTAINPWMTDAAGRLNTVDAARASTQWLALAAAYRSIGVGVQVVPAAPGLPDFCFCANQSLAFERRDGTHAVLLSAMNSPTRRGEVPFFARWYGAHGYALRTLPVEAAPFEGTGDAIWHPGRRLLWGGVGPRTAAAVWPLVEAEAEAPVVPLRLTDPRYYHLDTCLCGLDEETALVFPGAFDAAGLDLLRRGFARLIEVDEQEAANFACNAHCPDGRHVLLQQGSTRAARAIARRGFAVIELDTGEFMKSGGSVFCLKQELP